MPSIPLLIELHNQARKSWFYNRPTLLEDIELSKSASQWAVYMASNRRLINSNNTIDIVSENIGYGEPNEKEIMQTWLKSYRHKKNILNKYCNRIGCGFSYAKDDMIYWCVCFGKK